MAKKKCKESYSEYMSKTVINDPSMVSALPMGALYEAIEFSSGDDESTRGIDINVLQKAMVKQEALLAKGDLSSLEAMLFSQAHLLHSISSIMTVKMAKANHLEQLEVYGRIALKAQNQTRQTVSTLAEIKGIKKTTFIHQINNAHNQQVNNGAKEILNEATNEKVIDHVDTTSATERKGANQQNETVAISENKGRASAVSTECPKARHEVGSVDRVRKRNSRNESAS